MKTATKKTKIITETDIDGPMMSGKGMTKAEAIQMAKWVEEHKAAAKLKETKKLNKATKKL